MATSKPTGRPTKYREEYNEQAYRHCLLGGTNQNLAEIFGVDVSTIERWLTAHDEFRGAVRRGREDADEDVGKSLWSRANGFTTKEEKIFCDKGEVTRVKTFKHHPPDPASMIFWLKNRRPDLWRDTKVVEGNPDKPLGPVEITFVKAKEIVDP